MSPYACKDHQRPAVGEITHLAQDGYGYPIGVGNDEFERVAIWRPIRHVMSTDCRYDAQQQDPRCAGCQHIKNN